MTSFVTEIKILTIIFLENADETTRIKQEKMLHNHFKFYGLATKKRKPLIKWYLSQWYKKYNLEEKKKLFSTIYNLPEREFKYTALDFLMKWWRKELTYNDLNWLLELVKIDIWWETVDAIDNIFGTILLQHPDQREAKKYLIKLLSDPDDWVKRIAIQSQLMLKDKMQIDLVLEMVTPFLTTTNFYLIRSIGWALRNARRVGSIKISNFIIEQNVNFKIRRVINEH